ncbi:MAG: hypothetical protein G01um101419_586 [Parcubacteria group bacterium Gr01-1014_19]|nr:MAG: hypothetical protein G01um101419_586 [Parcubacteria group bacterium Gr01-1014_19]
MMADVKAVGVQVGQGAPRALLRREVAGEQDIWCAGCSGHFRVRNGDLKFLGYTRFMDDGDYGEYVATCQWCKQNIRFESQTELPGANLSKMIWCLGCQHYFQIRESDQELKNVIRDSKSLRPWWLALLTRVILKPSAILKTKCTYCGMLAEFDLLNNPHSEDFKRLVADD